MPGIQSDDIVLVFSARPWGRHTFSMYGIETDGDIVELFDPDTDYTVRPLFESLVPPDAEFSTTGGGYVVIDDDLYFNFSVVNFTNGGKFHSADMQVARLNGDGSIDMLFLDYGAENLSSTVGRGGFFPAAVEYQGNYAVPVITEYSGQNTMQYHVYPDTEGPRQITSFTRNDSKISWGASALGNELYFIADERSPLGTATLDHELWRLNPDGSQEFLYVDPNGTPTDVETFNGEAWFTVTYEPNVRAYSEDTELFRVAPGGAAVEVDLSSFTNLFSTSPQLKVLGDSLYMMTRSGLYRIDQDDTISDLLPNSSINTLWDFILFNDLIHFVGSSPDGNGLLYRLEANGNVTLVPDIPYSTANQHTGNPVFIGNMRELTVVGDTLYFTATLDVDDGYGGLQAVNALTSLDTNGTVTQITQDGGTFPNIDSAAGLFAFATAYQHQPQVGTSGNDTLVGTLGDDSLFGLDGDDFLYGDGLGMANVRDIANTVYRLYHATLDRDPDSAGYANWVSRILEEQRSLLEVSAGFVGSPEFHNTYGRLGDIAFVELLYQNVLDRNADDSGLSNWTGLLEAGMSRADVVLGFSQSQEFIGLTNTEANAFSAAHTPAVWADDVFRLYQSTLDRDPDLAGFTDWTSRLGSSGSNLSQVSAGFVGSREFQNTYGRLGDIAFVELLYQNVLDRNADDSGLTNWTDHLEAGMSRADVVLGFSQSQEFIRSTNAALKTWLRAQGDDDVLDGGAGSNVLSGGLFTDVFVFDASDNGTHHVLDLEVWDKLEFNGFGYTSASEVREHLSQSGSGVVFSDQGVNITFSNIQTGQISDDMIFV